MIKKLIIDKDKKLKYIEADQSFLLKEEGLIIKNSYCGICSSDLKIIKGGHHALKYPRVPGHEIIGQIKNIGTSFEFLKNEGFKEGDYVQIYPGITCGKCKYCTTGRENLCKNIKIIGFNYDGGFSSYSFFPEDIGRIFLNRLPDVNDAFIYSMAEPFASCVNVFENIEIYQNDTLLIIGAGFMGQILSITGDFYGLKNQYIMDFNVDRSVSLFPSNPNIVNVTKENEIDKIKEINPDIVILATGDFSLHNKLVEILNNGARICYFSGLSNPISDKKVNFNNIHYKEITIRGFYGSTPQQNKIALSILEKYKNIIESLFKVAVFPIEKYANALRQAYSHNFQKVILKID